MNEFGKFTRKLRIDRDELLKDMAHKLNVTPAYLSAVEIGKRKIPANWVSAIAKIYNLTKEQLSDLKKAYVQSCDALNLDLKEANKKQKNIAFEFIEGFSRLDDNDLDELYKILKRKKNKGEC